MKRVVSFLLLACLVVPCFALKTVNGKRVPEANDWGTFGVSPKYAALDTLLTSLANILPNESTVSTTISTTGVTVSDSAYIDTLTSAKATVTTGTVTTLTSTTVTVSDSAFIDTLKTQSLRVADPIGIDSISFKDNGSNDTLLIKINGRKFFIYPTRQE